jgi:hypothetical protein
LARLFTSAAIAPSALDVVSRLRSMNRQLGRKETARKTGRAKTGSYCEG